MDKGTVIAGLCLISGTALLLIWFIDPDQFPFFIFGASVLLVGLISYTLRSEMKTYYVLLIAGMTLFLVGLNILLTPYRLHFQNSPPYNILWAFPYAGIFGWMFPISGILISIVAGILIERDRKRS